MTPLEKAIEELRTAYELRACALSWEPNVMIVGNVRADDIAALCTDYIRQHTAQSAGDDAAMAEADAEVARTLAMSDDEIWAEAVREHGSPDAALKEANRIRDIIKNVTDRVCPKIESSAKSAHGSDAEFDDWFKQVTRPTKGFCMPARGDKELMRMGWNAAVAWNARTTPPRELLEKVREALKSCKEEFKFTRLHQQWFDEDMVTESLTAIDNYLKEQG